jgi:hypothetical protein
MRIQLNRATFFAILFASAGILSGLSSSASAGSNGIDKVKLNEIRNQNAVSVEPAVKPFSLIDLSKLKWSHSYTMSFGSNAFGSTGLGMYTGALFYEFSPKLSMEFALGVAQNLSGNAVNSTGDLFPSFSLDYHPSPKFRMRINVQRSPYSPYSSGRYSPYSPYGGFGSYGGFGNGFSSGYGYGNPY